ncbi:MAG: hypothetical protein VR64_09555 [Desulfatitalea sp. BRH_c12]|nr:MAG: hypothetical protein VR64_09555 [Desulfatitalea sp. BRH_c12]
MKIMVGYDGSEMAHRALLVAQKRAKSMQAELHIFTAAGAGKLDSPQNNRLQEGLKDSEMLCKACNIACKLEMSNQELSVAEDIVRYASANQMDEIVIGLRRRSQLGKLLFGSTSRQVILDATCPVLCIK